MARAAPVKDDRSAVFMPDCVVQDAAPANGTKAPIHAIKQTGRASSPNLNRKMEPKYITAAFQLTG